jgi:hypothetical protein
MPQTQTMTASDRGLIFDFSAVSQEIDPVNYHPQCAGYFHPRCAGVSE